MTEPAELLSAVCESCEAVHVAEYSHEGRYNEGPIYAVVCTRDWLTDYVSEERIKRDTRG